MVLHYRPRTSFFVLPVLMLTLCIHITHAQNADEERRGLVLLHIGRVNADCWPDTLLGSRCTGAARRSGAISYLPRLVLWGQPPAVTKGDKRQRDSITECSGPFAALRKKRTTTTFSYPAWEDLGGSVAVGGLNTNDTLPDLMVTVWGRWRDAQGVLHDTTRMVCVFSQHALDTVATIDLGGVSDEQREKFTARRMRKNAGLMRPGARDISGRTSWEIEPITLTTEELKAIDGEDPEHVTPALPLLNELHEQPQPNGEPSAAATSRQ